MWHSMIAIYDQIGLLFIKVEKCEASRRGFIHRVTIRNLAYIKSQSNIQSRSC